MATLRRRLLKAGIVTAMAGFAMLLHTVPALAAPGKVVFHDADNNIQVIDGGAKGQCVDLAVGHKYPYHHIRVANETSAQIRVFYTSDCKPHGIETFTGPQDVKAGDRGTLDGVFGAKSVMFLG